MIYRPDKNGNKLSILGFGCMRLPSALGRIDFDKTERLLLSAYEQGVNYFDTAYLYPGSEEALGKILKRNGLRNQVMVATKLPHLLCKQEADFNKYFNIQKERLQTDYIDHYLIHNIAAHEQWKKLCEIGIEKWIQGKKESGEIRQVGFSYHGPHHDFAPLLDMYDWDFCQIQYNYINEHYQAGTEGLQYAAGKGIPVFIMEPLLGGKLANGLPPKAAEIFRKTDKSRSPAQWGFRWLWDQPEVTMVLSGMNTPEQLNENIRTANECAPGCMTASERDSIQQVVEVFNSSYKIPCTGCNYCLPCPQKINIPALFAAYNTSYAMGRISGMYHYIISTAGLTDEPHSARSCIQCGKCEVHCPQHIPIRQSLKSVAQRLEPFWFRAIFPIGKRIMNR